MPDDVVRLVLPAEADYGRIARIAGSSLALRLGFAFAEIEDLRLAIDELVIVLLRHDGGAEDLDLTFTIGDHSLAIDATVRRAGDEPEPPVTDEDLAAAERFADIVRDTVDESEVDLEAGRARLVKRF